MSSDIDKKIQEYKDVQATDPEKLETLEAFDAAIQETRNAIAMVLLINDDTKFSKKKNLEPFQKHLVSILEQRENLLKDHPKHQKLKAQRQEFIEKQQIEDAQKAKDDLLRISLENVQTTFLNTPVDAKNIPISEFDLFYQNSYITLITNPGEMYTDPVSVEKKKPKKKVIIRNAAELQKQDFMKSILSSTIATEGR